MKRRGLLFVAIAVLLGVLALAAWKVWQNRVGENDPGKIRIGAILPLTGDGAIYGNDLQRGINLAFQQSPLKDKIELVFEDDAADVTTGINALNNLSFRGIDIVIGGIMSNVANGLLPIVNSKHILLLSPKATDVGLSRENDFFFRIWPTDDVDGKYAATYITDSLHMKRIAILYDNGTYGVGINREFKNNLKDKGVNIVFDEGFTSGQTNFKTQINKIKQLRPDVVFLPAYYKEVILILKQMNELNCDFYIAGVSSFNEQTVKNAAGRLEGKVFFTYPQFSVDNEDSVSAEFVKAFRETNPDREPNAFSAHGYDAFKVLENCISTLLADGKAVSADNLKSAMEKMDTYHGVTGDLRFDVYGDAEKGLQIIWLKDLKF